MLNKKALGAVMVAALTISSAALAGDRDFNTAAGAVIGAAIGHNSGGRDGALIGGLLGAVVGNSLSDQRPHNRGGHYEARAYRTTPGYYQPAPVYAPPPRYYGPPAVVYAESGRHRRHGYEQRWQGRHERHDHDRGGYDRGGYARSGYDRSGYDGQRAYSR
jgi:surface antigen